ncbi:CPBP family intramembrane metalloprotease [Candidatus Saccharibacteria bacterium]|nr:CPBP family intramembrane metalloprotease [Candidatus Saccharibacteria bacterium]
MQNSDFFKKIFKRTYGVEWIIWTAAGFFASIFIATGLIKLLSPLLSGVDFEGTLFNSVFSALVYMLMLAIVLGVPYYVRHRRTLLGMPIETKKHKKREFLKLIGLDRKPRFKDLIYAVAAFFMYYGVLFAILIGIGLIASFLGQEQTFEAMVGQQQEIGFARSGNAWWEVALIFVSLVIIPPVCEEIVMRGFLFGKLSKKMKFVVAAVLTSLLFALAHGQLNVGIDTFVLSMILCFARINTGSIWTGIFVHMLKNGLAFALLFGIIDIGII